MDSKNPGSKAADSSAAVNPSGGQVDNHSGVNETISLQKRGEIDGTEVVTLGVGMIGVKSEDGNTSPVRSVDDEAPVVQPAAIKPSANDDEEKSDDGIQEGNEDIEDLGETLKDLCDEDDLENYKGPNDNDDKPIKPPCIPPLPEKPDVSNNDMIFKGFINHWDGNGRETGFYNSWVARRLSHIQKDEGSTAGYVFLLKVVLTYQEIFKNQWDIQELAIEGILKTMRTPRPVLDAKKDARLESMSGEFQKIYGEVEKLLEKWKVGGPWFADQEMNDLISACYDGDKSTTTKRPEQVKKEFEDAKGALEKVKDNAKGEEKEKLEKCFNVVNAAGNLLLRFQKHSKGEAAPSS